MEVKTALGPWWRFSGILSFHLPLPHTPVLSPQALVKCQQRSPTSSSCRGVAFSPGKSPSSSSWREEGTDRRGTASRKSQGKGDLAKGCWWHHLHAVGRCALPQCPPPCLTQDRVQAGFPKGWGGGNHKVKRTWGQKGRPGRRITSLRPDGLLSETVSEKKEK
jgi:hypothetical protein